jgi:small subunit ribosomal protein S15
MYLTKEIKEEIFAKHGEKKTLENEAQIALFTYKLAI